MHYGNQVDNDGTSISHQKPINGKMPQLQWLEFWHQVVYETLQARRRKYDPVWREMKQLVENSEGGQRTGNLASDFIKTLHSRLLRKDIVINVEADDSEYMDQGEKAEVVANSIARVAGLQEAIRSVITNATWASFGALEVGHPIDPASMSVMHVFRTPNVQSPETPADLWQEVDQVPEGVENEMVRFPDDYEPMEQPEPIFSPGVGYPWISSVDPRLIVMPLNIQDPSQSPWIARLRFLTRGELLTILGYDPGEDAIVSGEWSDLFAETEGDSGSEMFPEMCCIVELYIRRDRNSPTYNNWFLSFVLGHPERVLWSSVNPWGGMVPIIVAKLDGLKPAYSTTLAQELAPFTDAYHKGARAMLRQMEDLLNEKHFVGSGAGLSPESERRLYNPHYRGPIPVNDVNSIKRVNEQKFNTELLQGMTYVKSIAQSRSGQSDIDRGAAIKEITARQTQALLDATGISVESMGTQVSLAGREAVMKLMHLTGLFSTAARGRRYNYGGRFASQNAGTHDYVNSMIYKVTVEDNAEQFTSEDRLLWVQFLRVLFGDTQGQMIPFLDREGLTRETLKVFSRSPALLASRAAGRAPQGVNPQLEAMISGGQGGPPGAPGGQVIDLMQGQHPERQQGSRGVDLGNAMRGLLGTGSGTGEM